MWRDLALRFATVCLLLCAARTASPQSAPTLLLPIAVAYDSSGNLFFADGRRHQVFELTLAGTWSIVAGTGEQGFAGDGGPATAALLNGPRGLAVATDGTLYIADSGNQRIRAVVNGTITTVAGTGARGYSGDGVALQGALRDPTALAMDAAGNLLMCDTGNQRVRRLSAGRIATVAGNGVQGFSGDGGIGTAAELDTPLGVAVGGDGTVFIADTHNQRVRSLSPGGVIGTFAGSGLKGFAGDGAQARVASLDMPYGVAVSKEGSLLIADAGNQVMRSVAVNGVISTVVGSGVQGTATEATPGPTVVLNSPRAVSVQFQGQPVFADSRSGFVRELANDNALYTLALLASPRISSVTLTADTAAVYGQGAAVVNVTGVATPQGTAALLDNGSVFGSTQLAAGRSSFSLGELPAGSHLLTATYAGDGLNESATSMASSLRIAAAPATAVANAATATYGASLPLLSGTLSGILPRDIANVHAVFTTAAASLAPAGTYPIAAALTGQGSANYALVAGANSGSLTITPAASITTMSQPTVAYAGLPLLLSAAVTSSTSGAPNGNVDFLEGGSVLGSASLIGGTASASLLSATGGAHSYSARYSGDTNFLPSVSSTSSVTVAAVPDFIVALGSASQFVQGGSAAIFTVNVSPQSGPFTGAIVFSVTGLPQGATASFSPSSVVPGASTAGVTLSVQTIARTGALHNWRQFQLASLFGLTAAIWWLPTWRRRGLKLRQSLALLSFVLIGALAITGCGTRTTGASEGSGQTYSLTIRGTGTNLAGAAVMHSTTAALTVY